MRNKLSQLLVVEMGKAFLEQGLQAQVMLQRRQRKCLRGIIDLCWKPQLESLG